jgi:hypothetical protein
LARSGASSTITAAIRRREQQAEALDRELTALVRREQVSQVEVSRLAVLARQKVEECRRLLRQHVPEARRILRKMLRDRLVFVPQIRNRRLGYRGTILPLLAGAVPGVVPAGSGFVPNGNCDWLRAGFSGDLAVGSPGGGNNIGDGPSRR